MREKGIILQKINYKEYDKIIYLLSACGKESLLVRKANRLKAGLTNLTEPLTYIEYTKSNTSLPVGSEITGINYYLPVKDNPIKWAIAEYTIEVLYHLNYQDIDTERLFLMMVEFYNALASHNNLTELYLQFQIKMLYFRGLMPNMQMCGVCSTIDNLVGIDAQLGSLVCNKHASNALSFKATEAFIEFYKDKTFNLSYSKAINNELKAFLNSYTAYHFDFKPKATTLVDEYLKKDVAKQ